MFSSFDNCNINFPRRPGIGVILLPCVVIILVGSNGEVLELNLCDGIISKIGCTRSLATFRLA